MARALESGVTPGRASATPLLKWRARSLSWEGRLIEMPAKKKKAAKKSKKH